MKKIRITLPILAALVILGIAAAQVLPAHSQTTSPAAQTPSTSRTITAWGHGEVAVTPDQASIVLGVQSRATTARVALSGNNTKINAILSALVKQGIPNGQIQTNDLSVWFDSQSARYIASHNLGIRLLRVDKVGAVLDAAIGAGANNSFGVSFSVKDSSKARASALKAAIADARNRATTIAQTLKASITQTVAVDEAASGYVTKSGGAMGMGGGGGTPVQPGQYVVSADVNVTYTYG